MSRSISIWYRKSEDAPCVDIEVNEPYYLLGCQQPSMGFWALPRLREIGIERLTYLGIGDPIFFSGWEDLAVLGREIMLIQEHIRSIDYHPETMASWLAHLVYCHSLLLLVTPADCIPELMIG
jgi:hypothetical protein